MKHTNSVFKKALSVFLCAVMMLSVISVGIIVPGAKLTADAAERKNAATICGDFTFIVPETIYLTPLVNSWTVSTSSSFQYYINNTTANEPKNTRDTNGLLYYSYAGASNATLSYKFLKGDMSAELSGGSIGTNLSNNKMNSGESYSVTSGTSPQIAAGDTGCYIEWCLTYNDTNASSVQKKAYAYTYVYKPYVIPTAAGATLRCTDGKDHDNSQLTWMSGFHNVYAEALTPTTGDSDQKAAYPRYSLVSQGKTSSWAFAPFLSYDTGTISGDTNYPISNMNNSGNQAVANTRNNVTRPDYRKQSTAMKLAFASFTDAQSYFKCTGIDNYWAHDWMSTSNTAPSNGTPTKDTTFNKKTCSFYYYYSGEDQTSCIDTGGIGGIYIDTSRYTNLNQIPNLGVGMMMTDNKDTSTSDDGAWMIGDYTGWTSSTYAGHQNNGNKMRDEWTNVNYYIAGMGHPDNRVNGYDSQNLKYAGNWNRELISGEEQTYQIKSAQMNNQNGDWITVQVVLKLHAYQYNKTNLRAAVKNATKIMAKVGVNGASNGLLSSMYFDADNYYKWNTFQTAYKNAVIALTKVDGSISDITATTDALNNAIAGLKTKVTVDGNGGTLTGTASEYVTVGTTGDVNQTYNYTPSCTATRKGYTFKGWDVSPNSSYPLTTVTVGYNDTIYAIWEKIPYTATFIKQVPTADSATTIDTKNYDVETSFTFPVSASEDYYTFDNQWEVVNTNEDYWPLTNTYGAGNTSTAGAYGNVTFKAKLTPVDYTITFDPAGGSAVNEQNLIHYDYTSNTALPAITRIGFSFAGWKPEAVAGNWDSTVTYKNIQKMHGNVKLIAQWTSVSSTVTLNIGSGESISGNTSLTYAFANSLQLSNPSKVGYTFKGWKVTRIPVYSTEPTANRWVIDHEYLLGSEEKVTLPANMLGDVTLTPIWEANSYRVTYNSNGGTTCTPKDYKITDTFNLAAPTRNGYMFTGWSVTDHDNVYNWTSSTYTGDQSVSGKYGNVTLTANWAPVTYTVTLNVNGGDALTDNTLDYDIDGATTLPVPTRTGYDFTGWKLTACDAQSDWASYTGRPTDDIYTDALPQGHYGSLTLTAQWEHKAYTITLNTTGSNGGSRTYYIDSELFTLGSSELPGYSFKNWKVNADAGNWTKDTTYLATAAIVNKFGDVTLTAQFDPISYTVTYQDADGEQIGAAVNYTIEDTLTLDTYNKDGYTFEGWKVKSVTSGGGWNVGDVLSAGDLTANMYYGNVVLEPVLTPVEYKLTFIPDGGTAYPQKTYTIETDDYTLPEPTKTGYDFAGWKVTTAAGNWTENAVFAAGTSVAGKYGSATLTATWTAKKYAITYIVGNTTLYPAGITKEGTFAQTAPDLTDAEKAKPSDAQYDYTFDHWDPALGTVTGEATYRAVYTQTLRSYDITWMLPDDVGGTLGDYTAQTTPNVNYGDTPVFNNGVNPTLTSDFPDDYSWRFAGWSTTAGGTVLENLPAVTGTATYYAVFTKVLAPEKVNWVIEDVTNTELWGIGETPEWRHDTPVKPDANGYKYTFTGWTPTIVPVVQNNTYTYTAQFSSELQTYTYSFNANGAAEAVSGGNYKMGDTIAFPTVTKTGYTFAGWLLDAAVGTWTADTLVSAGDYITNTLWGNVSFTAQWTPVTYTITYNKAADDDTVPAAQSYNIESTDTLGAATRDGYTLSGWIVATASGNWTQGTILAPDASLNGFWGNVTLSPVWQVNTYTIKWISGDAEQTSEVEYGSAILAFPPSSKMGYTADWDAEVPATMPAHDLTFTAVYTPVEYYIRVNVNGGSAVDNFYYTINGDDVLPTPTRDGATFIGWKVTAAAGNWSKNTVLSGGASLNGKYGNVSLTAQWQMRTCTVIWNAGDVTKETIWYYGATPSFDGTPYKSPDEYNSYVFTGWDKAITPVTEDEVTYTALFEATERIYTVTWNIDGVTTTEEYKYGETPSYKGSAPVRPETAEYVFTFSGWSPEITALTKDVTYVAQFDVFTKIQGLSLNTSAKFLDLDTTTTDTLTATIYPATATVRDLVWTSLDPNVATVNNAGQITAVNNGVTVIKVSSIDGAFNSYCAVTVKARNTSYVSITAGGVSTTQLPGTTIQLSATVMPDNATNTEIVWSSSAPSVATVDQNGLVTFVNTGDAVITAASKDGYAVGTIKVKTTQNQEEVEDTAKTYLVEFASASQGFIVKLVDGSDSAPYRSVVIKYAEGSEVVFRLVNTSFTPLVNGISYKTPDEDGYYHIKDLNKNLAIVDEIIPIGTDIIDPDKDKNDAPSFWARVQAFFRKIVEFFRSLFK